MKSLHVWLAGICVLLIAATGPRVPQGTTAASAAPCRVSVERDCGGCKVPRTGKAAAACGCAAPTVSVSGVVAGVLTLAAPAASGAVMAEEETVSTRAQAPPTRPPDAAPAA